MRPVHRFASGRPAGSTADLPVPLPLPRPRGGWPAVAAEPRPGRRLHVPFAVGAVAAVAFVGLYGHTHPVVGAVPSWRWFGLLDVPTRSSVQGAASVGAWLALLTLTGAWWTVVRRVRAGGVLLRTVAGGVGAWSIPFVVGPPLTSLDIYNFAAQGVQVLHGQNPYSQAPAALGASAVLGAVDPRWRGVHSPYGPLGLRIEWLAALVGHGHATATVVGLRVVAVVCTLAAVALGVSLVARAHRPLALLLLASPLVLTNLVSAGHLEAPMLALLVGAVLAERRGHPLLALLLALAAGLVKAPALLGVVFLLVQHQRTAGVDLRRAVLGWRVAARDVAVLLAGAAGATLLVTDAWGWTRTVVHTPAMGRGFWTPTTALAEVIAAGARLAGSGMTLDGALSVTRVCGFGVSGAVVAVLLVRSGGRAWVAALGTGLVAVALLGFILYPWYVLWGLPLLVVAARRRIAVGASAAACAFGWIYLFPALGEWAGLARAALRHPTWLAGAVTALAWAVGAVAVARRTAAVAAGQIDLTVADRFAAAVERDDAVLGSESAGG
ncbi:MAG: hypothetical protein JWM48_1381 [Mycobacterium sp.]|nr:hypothetical protein [Mycobacterium sp.]